MAATPASPPPPAAAADAPPPDLSAHSRRLRLRNSLVRPSRLSYGSSGPASPPRRFTLTIDDTGWETEDPEPEATPGPAAPENSSNSAKKRRNRNSTGSLLATSDEPQQPDPVLERAMTSPSPGKFGHRRNRSGSEGGAQQQGNARYVDYLERQVADLMVQLQAYTAPAGGGASHATKMRRLSAEARNLRTELNDWEAKFNVRVADEVAQRTAQDISLRGKMHALEERLEEAQDRCRCAEEELEDARERLREMKGLEEENRALGFRIETLTEMLAASTEAGGSGGSAAPVSPAAPPTALVLAASPPPPPKPATPAESRRHSLEMSPLNISPGGLSDYGISDPLDQILSTLSTTPPTPSPTLRSRRMRRFPSGSSAPKTLILPSAASPTLPTIRTFFGASISDPSSMCAPSSPRPSSSGSTSAPGPRPSANSANSLFAELARAEDDTAPPSPELATLITDSIRNPTPLLYRAITEVSRGPLTTARKKAISVLSHAVGSNSTNGIDRRRMRRKPGRSTRCECGCLTHSHSSYPQQQQQVSVVKKPTDDADDAVENVWLWVRFVVALVVALGVAVREGPAVVLGGEDETGVHFDSVNEEEREVAIRSLGGGRVYGVRAVHVPERWERERAGSGGGVHVGEGRRKGMEWGV